MKKLARILVVVIILVGLLVSTLGVVSAKTVKDDSTMEGFTNYMLSAGANRAISSTVVK